MATQRPGFWAALPLPTRGQEPQCQVSGVEGYTHTPAKLADSLPFLCDIGGMLLTSLSLSPLTKNEDENRKEHTVGNTPQRAGTRPSPCSFLSPPAFSSAPQLLGKRGAADGSRALYLLQTKLQPTGHLTAQLPG